MKKIIFAVIIVALLAFSADGTFARNLAPLETDKEKSEFLIFLVNLNNDYKVVNFASVDLNNDGLGDVIELVLVFADRVIEGKKTLIKMIPGQLPFDAIIYVRGKLMGSNELLIPDVYDMIMAMWTGSNGRIFEYLDSASVEEIQSKRAL